MANTLTAVIPSIYEGLDMVSREQVGFIAACYKNSTAERAGKDQTISYPIVGTMAAADVTPAATSSSGTDRTITAGSMTISKVRKVTFNWTGEEQRSLSNGDRPQLNNILANQFAQAFRTLANEIEADLWAAAYKGSSRGYGTAGTTPFATAGDLSDFAGVRQILDNNGAPQSDLHLVVGSAAMAKLRGVQSVLFKVNEAGTSDFLRMGILGEVMGLNIHNSYPITTHTKGTGTSYQLNGALAVGDTTVTVDTGSGTLLAGDIITIAGTSDKYVANTALSGGVFTIGAPGSLAIEADNDAITIGNNYTPNVAFHRMALHLVTRQPAMPVGGDSADDVQTVTDPVSGISFEIALYRQYRQLTYEVACAWGVEAVKSAHIATLLG